MLSDFIAANFTLIVMLTIFVVLVAGTGRAYWKLFNDRV
jgi:hypothetical protein